MFRILCGVAIAILCLCLAPKSQAQFTGHSSGATTSPRDGGGYDLSLGGNTPKQVQSAEGKLTSQNATYQMTLRVLALLNTNATSPRSATITEIEGGIDQSLTFTDAIFPITGATVNGARYGFYLPTATSATSSGVTRSTITGTDGFQYEQSDFTITGGLSAVPTTPYNIGVSYSFPSTPEPGSLAILGIACTAVLRRPRRRRAGQP